MTCYHLSLIYGTVYITCSNLNCIHIHILQTIIVQYLVSKVDIISHVPGDHYGPDHHGGASHLPRSVSCMALGT